MNKPDHKAALERAKVISEHGGFPSETNLAAAYLSLREKAKAYYDAKAGSDEPLLEILK